MSRKHGTLTLPDRPKARLVVRSEEIQSRAPLAQASLQMMKGMGGVEKIPPARLWFDGPPKLRAVPKGQQDPTGKVHGRVTVMGLIDKGGHHTGRWNKQSWAVRCSCGVWEPRCLRVVMAGKRDGTDDMCHVCQHTENLRLKSLQGLRPLSDRQKFFADNGFWPPYEWDGEAMRRWKHK